MDTFIPQNTDSVTHMKMIIVPDTVLTYQNLMYYLSPNKIYRQLKIIL